MTQTDALNLRPQLDLCFDRLRPRPVPIVSGSTDSRQITHPFHGQFALLLGFAPDLRDDPGSPAAASLRLISFIRCKAPLKKRFSAASCPTSLSNWAMRSAWFSAMVVSCRGAGPDLVRIGLPARSASRHRPSTDRAIP